MTINRDRNIAPSTDLGWHISIWTAQLALAGLYGAAAYIKLLAAPETLADSSFTRHNIQPLWVVRIVGGIELAVVLGLILPTATRVWPQLTIHVARGVMVIQLLTIGYLLGRGDFPILPFNFIYFVLAAWIFWGRAHKAPIKSRLKTP